MKSVICACGGKVPPWQYFPFRGHRAGCEKKRAALRQGQGFVTSFAGLDKEGELENESRQPPDLDVYVTLATAKSDGRGWRLTGPLAAFWRLLRGKP